MNISSFPTESKNAMEAKKKKNKNKIKTYEKISFAKLRLMNTTSLTLCEFTSLWNTRRWRPDAHMEGSVAIIIRFFKTYKVSSLVALVLGGPQAKKETLRMKKWNCLLNQDLRQGDINHNDNVQQ